MHNAFFSDVVMNARVRLRVSPPGCGWLAILTVVPYSKLEPRNNRVWDLVRYSSVMDPKASAKQMRIIVFSMEHDLNMEYLCALRLKHLPWERCIGGVKQRDAHTLSEIILQIMLHLGGIVTAFQLIFQTICAKGLYRQ